MSNFIRKLKKKLKLLFIFLIVCIFLLIMVIEFRLQPVLHNVYRSDVTSMLSQIINRAVNEETDTLSYNDLVTIETNRDGHIILMQPDLQSVNNISSNISIRIQKHLNQSNSRIIEIPVFQILGIEILSQYSPRIAAQIIPYGYVKTSMNDVFKSAGINQTRHKIYLRIQTKVNVMVPFLSEDVVVDTEFPITEAVIVGQVPDTYISLEEGLFKEGTIRKGE